MKSGKIAKEIGFMSIKRSCLRTEGKLGNHEEKTVRSMNSRDVGLSLDDQKSQPSTSLYFLLNLPIDQMVA